jgi:signal transduction histidine kinase
MIAHQWRQPLNVISSVAIRLNLKNELGKLEQDDIKNISGLIGSKVQEMSNIINDFMEFNKPDANSKFKLIDAVKTVIDMSEAQFKSRGIEIEVDVDENLEVFHNLKSIEHVLLNLLTNSRDAFAENKDITTRLIKIYTTKSENGITLSVEDNAGGIKKDILHKIFNPYFTTKEQGKGTGIGLYMSKKMVESVSNAKLSVEVIENRTIFHILFPVEK